MRRYDCITGCEGRRVIAAGLLFLLLLVMAPCDSRATPDLSQLGTVNLPDTMLDLAVAGNLAYVADRATGLEIFDVSRPEAPLLKGQFSGNGTGYQVAVVGNRAYLAASAHLYIIDVSDPSAPQMLGIYTPVALNNQIGGVAVRNNIAYVGAGVGGLQILDVSIPASPRLISSLTTANAGRVVLSGNFAVYEGQLGIAVADISNPQAPRSKAFFENETLEGPSRFTVSGSLIFACNLLRMKIYDLAAPGGPSLRSSTELPVKYSGIIYDVITLRNSLAYVATSFYDGTHDLRVYDVSSPDQPLLRAMDPFTVKGQVPYVAAVGGDLYVGSFAQGVSILHSSAVPAATLKVATPSGITSFKGGDQIKVHWQADVTVAGTAVNFELWNSQKNIGWLGYDWSPGGDSTKTLTLPLVPVASDYRIRAISMWDPKIYAVNSTPFTVTGGPVRLGYPTGKITWSRNTRQPVGWQSNPLVSGTSVGIELWRGGRRVKVLGYGWNPAGQAVTTVWIPGYLSPASDYKLRITSVFVPYYDENSGWLTIR